LASPTIIPPEYREERPRDQAALILLDDDCACGVLRRASRAVTQLYDLVLVPTGLKATQFLVLKTLFEAGEIAQCDFAREHTIAIETLSRRFSSLREKGLIEVRIGPHHNERIYRLTPLGRKRFDDAVPYWALAQQRLRHTLGEADWKVLLGLPHRVCKAALAAEQARTRNHLSTYPTLTAAPAAARRKLYSRSSK
jgi:DNA-binding MarR family transcriptional regulator